MIYAASFVLILMLIVVFSSRFVGGWASVLGKRVHLPPLDGQVYIVTGGSRGVGWQVCVRYAEVEGPGDPNIATIYLYPTRWQPGSLRPERQW